MQDRIFIIFAPPFDPISGGVVALHKLCHVLNEVGQRAYLFPYVPGLPVDVPLFTQLQMGFNVPNANITRLEVHPEFKTPVLSLENLSAISQSDQFIVVYPEIVWGNPLDAKNVVRWFLHNPGNFSRKVYYGTNELYFRFGLDTKPAIIPGSRLSDSLLSVHHCPTDLYNLEGVAEVREGTAVCIRKGRGKPFIHDPGSSIVIDGKPHPEVAAIFKKVKRLISYDTRTYYSNLAVLCGCESIVVPDPGVSEEEWQPLLKRRLGIAYGMENLERARETAPLALEAMLEDERHSSESVKSFVAEANDYFGR